MLGLVGILLGLISLDHPNLLNDNNGFLESFVNHELLATLGFIVAVTLASAASLHLELNRLEDETGVAFSRTRSSIRKCAYSLLALLVGAVVLVVTKPILWGGYYESAFANSAAILIIVFNLFVLYALTRTVFAIPTVAKIKEARSEQSQS